MQMLWRTLIGVVVFLICLWLVPLVLGILGVPLTGAFEQLLKGIGALLVIFYILWGPPVRPPG